MGGVIMIERYGKSFDIFRIKRSLSELDNIIEKCHDDSNRFAVDETDGGGMPGMRLERWKAFDDCVFQISLL